MNPSWTSRPALAAIVIMGAGVGLAPLGATLREAPAPARAAAGAEAPAGTTDESLVTLLYTVNNLGYTGTCG